MSRWVLVVLPLVALPCRAEEESRALPAWLSLVASPVNEQPLGNTLAGQLEVEAGFRASVQVFPFLAVGTEYSVALGPQVSQAPLSEQAHRLLGVIDFGWGWGALTLALGVGLSGPERWMTSLALEFDLR
ncbi:MAG: hypothetical protein Q8L48_04590 [Archangium sp.]|nr:hypothetical protein [Archangium sp.]